MRSVIVLPLAWYTISGVNDTQWLRITSQYIWKARAWPHHFTTNMGSFGPIKLVKSRHFLLKCQYKARKGSSAKVFVPLSTILIFDFGSLWYFCVHFMPLFHPVLKHDRLYNCHVRQYLLCIYLSFMCSELTVNFETEKLQHLYHKSVYIL